MIKKVGFVILLLLFSVFAFCQKVIVRVTMDNKVAAIYSDTIYYSGNRPLTWEDFRGIPNNNSVAGAVTSSGFAFNANMNRVDNEVCLNVNVYCFFSKKNSWKNLILVLPIIYYMSNVILILPASALRNFTMNC